MESAHERFLFTSCYASKKKGMSKRSKRVSFLMHRNNNITQWGMHRQ